MGGRLCRWEGVRVRADSDRDETDGVEVIYERILLLLACFTYLHTYLTYLPLWFVRSFKLDIYLSICPISCNPFSLKTEVVQKG